MGSFFPLTPECPSQACLCLPSWTVVVSGLQRIKLTRVSHPHLPIGPRDQLFLGPFPQFSSLTLRQAYSFPHSLPCHVCTHVRTHAHTIWTGLFHTFQQRSSVSWRKGSLPGLSSSIYRYHVIKALIGSQVFILQSQQGMNEPQSQ